MTLRRTRRLTLPLSLLLLGGCSYPFCADPDRVAGELASRPIDVRPAAGEVAPAPPAAAPAEPAAPGLRPVPVPPEVPGGGVPALAVPPLEKGKEAARDREIDRLFPPLPPPGDNPRPPPGPQGRPLELQDLQQLALGSSPLIKQAAAEVDAARGAVIQAGAYPNPIVGYEQDAIGEGDPPNKRATAGQVGGYVSQTIKTKGKLQLAQAAAEQDLRNAEYALRRAEFDLLAQVRGGYFAVLSAQESMRVALAFVRFTEAIYRIQVGQLKAGQVAGYEPLQFRALAVQARVTLAQARHRYVGAWKQLTAVTGVPGLPPAQLAGRIDMAVPVYRYEDVAARVLARHTDVLAARTRVERARYNLRLALVTPCPDIDVRVLVQKDYTTAPFNVMTGVQVGGPIPLWDRNRGNILRAEAELERATEEEHRVRDDLARQLADAFERYHLSRELLAPYRGTLLPDQVRVLNGLFERYLSQGTRTAEVTFIDISTAQQNLVTSVTAYLQALGERWRAAVDIAALLQTEDLFQTGREPPPTECLPPLPDFDQVLPLPCEHPCSPLPDPGPRGNVDPAWPAALPGRQSPEK
jgi:cobalt-zinc-cadmium efflux system outer membrane protein